MSQAFQNAVVLSSTFDAYYALLEAPEIRNSLEVVTSEAGDSWIYGCSSDPRKLALLRLFTRHRDAAAKEKEPGIDRFSLLLLKASEHTWGLDGRCQTPGKGDVTHWSNVDFAKVRASPLFTDQEDAWNEQRSYFGAALAALAANSTLAMNIKAELAELDTIVEAAAKRPPTSSKMRTIPASEFGNSVQLTAESGGGGMQLQLDPASGGIVKLVLDDGSGGTDGADDADGADADGNAAVHHSWASPSNPLARFVYKSRSFQAGVHYYNRYQWQNASWGPRVYEKIGVTPAVANETLSHARIVAMAANSSAIVVDLMLPSEAWTVYGGPRKLRLMLLLPSVVGGLQVTLVVLNKTATRIAEEAWFEFRPVLPPSAASFGLVFDKLGSHVRPTDMLTNGSKTLHGINPGGDGVVFTAPAAAAPSTAGKVGPGTGGSKAAPSTAGKAGPGTGGSSQLRVAMLDAGLVSPGPAEANMDLYAFPGVNCTATDGVAVSLWNNLWSVNYVFWYPFAPEDASFAYRFVLQVS